MNSNHAIKTKMKRKIRKLLSLASSPNSCEAESARRKAKKLLAENRLTLQEIKCEKPDILDIRLDSDGKLNPWETKLIGCITKVSSAEVLSLHGSQKKHLRIIGREADVISARNLFCYLHDAIDKKAAAFSESIDDLESFRIGMVESVKEKLEQKFHSKIKAASTGKETTDYIQIKYGIPESADSWYGIDENSYGLGKAIGRKIHLHDQIPGE